APFATATGSVEINLDKTVMGIQSLGLSVTVNDPAACTKTQTNNNTTQINYDDVANASATDDVESNKPLWTVTSKSGVPGTVVWTGQQPTRTNHIWSGVD